MIWYFLHFTLTSGSFGMMGRNALDFLHVYLALALKLESLYESHVYESHCYNNENPQAPDFFRGANHWDDISGPG